MNNSSIRTFSALAIAIATASSGAYAAELEEIIVTATKRAESLQEVPVSLTAISGTKIEDAGMHSFAELLMVFTMVKVVKSEQAYLIFSKLK